MYEVDFLPVGDDLDDGDAIALRFMRPDTGGWAHVVVDAGLEADGAGLVAHVTRHYATDALDLAILTHPDRDHIGGMVQVVRDLHVKELWIHNVGAHGGRTLAASAAVEDLIRVARIRGTLVREPWAGRRAFGGAVTVLGPARDYYETLVARRLREENGVATRRLAARPGRGRSDRWPPSLAIERPLAAQDAPARNDTSIITLLAIGGRRLLLTGDAGVEALQRAWNLAERIGLAGAPDFVQIPHHGARRNASSAWLDRLLGPAGQPVCRTAYVSVGPESSGRPSGRVVNAYQRRGCRVIATSGRAKRHSCGVPGRAGWEAAHPLEPMIEEREAG